jgi:hypothetical protein
MVIKVGEKWSYESSAQGGGREKQSQFLPREPPAAAPAGWGRKDPCSTAAPGCGIQRTTLRGGGAERLFVTRVSAPNKPNLPQSDEEDHRPSRGQSRQTKPIGRKREGRQVLREQRVIVDLAHKWPWQNKAKLGQDGTSGGNRTGEVDCAKQTQFPALPEWDEAKGTRAAGCSVQTNPIARSGAPRRCRRMSRPADEIPTIPLFHRSSIPIFVVQPSQQWGCGHIDGAESGSILSGDSIR